MNDREAAARNVVSGTAGANVVQAGTIRGGVHLQQAIVTPPIPRQLLPVTQFTGRDRELSDLDRLLATNATDGRPAMVVLSGPGGIGKSALASYWLTSNAARFADGQLYADLGAFGGSGGVRDPGDVLGGFLRALGVPAEQVPLDLGEQTALYRSVTADKALAVLADDAESAAQVRPLLPASSRGVVVVTSRWRLAGLAMDGGRVLTVDTLGEDAAIGLLRDQVGAERVGAEPENARHLVRLCGGLPVALRVAAARLSVRPHWSLEHVVSVLSDERRRLPELAVSGDTVVQANFDLSYQELSAPAARLYRTLGLHPGASFGPGVAGAAIETAEPAAEDLLYELVDASLLTDLTPQRYRYHDLLRLHAHQQAHREDPGPRRSAALERMVRWYLTTTISADLVAMPLRVRLGSGYQQADRAAFANAPSALDWVEQERPNLVAAIEAATRNEWWEPVWQLCEALWSFFLYRKHFSDWIWTHQQGIRAAGEDGNPRAEARVRVQLGYAYLNLHDVDAATNQFTEAYGLSRAAEDGAGEATALEHLGLAAQSAGRVEAAIEYFRSALRMTSPDRQLRATSMRTRRLGDTLSAAGRHQEAIPHLDRAVTTAAELGDAVMRARALTSLGRAKVHIGASAAAEAGVREAVEALREWGADHYRAEALEVLAEIRADLGDPADAVAQLRDAVQLYERLAAPRATHAATRLRELSRD